MSDREIRLWRRGIVLAYAAIVVSAGILATLWWAQISLCVAAVSALVVALVGWFANGGRST